MNVPNYRVVFIGTYETWHALQNYTNSLQHYNRDSQPGIHLPI